MKYDKMQTIIRLLLEDELGYVPIGNLVFIVDGQNGPHVFSNAPDRETVEEYLKYILNHPNKIDQIRDENNESHTKQ